MSGFGGFGGFGQNNNQQQQNTGFGGGFGSNATANTGFGSTGTTGFGSTNNTGGGLFGSGGTTGGFGSSGGFGNTTNNAFGAKPSGFGTTATTGSSLFGGGTTTAGSSGFGGFGSTTPAATSTFGSNNTGGGLFGAAKPAFGATPASSNPFGGAAASSSGFGGTTPATGAFGSPASTALGGGAGECQGTGSVPFQPFIEKEPNSSTNQQNAFQSICFQQPYQKFSPEELRLADYNQGRRYGNASNQAGAFGATNFGGFGSTNTNTSTGFGSTNTNTNTGSSLFGGGTSTGFGSTQPASTGFGSTATTGGGLFGAAKPATGSLFGSQPAAQPSGGLFGSTQTTGGFGSGTTGGFGAANANTGSSLFGNNNAAAKPAFSFGNNATSTATGTGFGATPAATGGFGSGGLFGSNTQQQNTTTGFGAQPAATTGFGGFGAANNQQQTGSSLFGGNNQAKPAGSLFGAAAPAQTSSLFGNTQTATNTNSPFGANTNTQNNTGGLFGNKPAATGSSLFGATNTQTNTTGGLFGGGFGTQNQTQPQQQNTGGLFGGLNNNNNQQKPGGLFGNTGTQQQSGGLFGNSNNQQQGSSLFGGLGSNNQQQQQQQPQNSLFGANSMFGGSQQGQQPQSLTASISDANAYGGRSGLFSDIGPMAQVVNPGPLATPLTSSINRKKQNAALPLYKLSSASSRIYQTPPKQFGFSYGGVNSPGSVSSTASTPGAFSNSLLGASSFGRGLSKSISTSSLRRTYNAEDSILAPGAFSASPNNKHFGSTGSVKKLTISRNIRADLFSPPNPQSQTTPSTPLGSILKKRVSFNEPGASTNGAGVSSPLKTVNTAEPSTADTASGRSRSGLNGSKPTTGISTPPEMEQVPNSNNQLAIVNEDEAAAPVQSNQIVKKPISQEDQEPGDYWMSPTKQEIENMNRAQRSKVTNLTVGRVGVGQVQFNAPVDLNLINLDEIMGDIVQLSVRSATVYAIAAKKPPRGKGLNVPSTISLENSWPRKKKAASSEKLAATQFKKHTDRLRQVQDTEFVSYDRDTGVWTFKVEHFTTYGFPDEEEDESDFGQSTLSAPPDTPTPKMRTPRSIQHDESFASTSQLTYTESDPDDTFEFRNKKKVLPGAFDDQEVYADEEMGEEYNQEERESFLDERSVGSQSENGVEEPMDQDDVFQDGESVNIVDQDMAGSYPQFDNTAELDEDSQTEGDDMNVVTQTPGAMMRARMRPMKSSGTPLKQKFSAGDDWANALKSTVSPQKQDRALLKSLIDVHGNDTRLDAEHTPMPRRVVSDGRGFATSIDLMNSLLGQARSPVKVAKVPATAKGFEWPYAKRPKTGDHDTSNMESKERAFHDSMKPSWGPDGTLVYAAPPNAKPFGRSSRRARDQDGLLTILKGGVVSEGRDIRFAKFSNEAAADRLKKHIALATIDDSSDVPFANLPSDFSFADFYDELDVRDPAALHEKLVWQLASVLFDPIEVPEELHHVHGALERLQKEKLSTFWQKLVADVSSKHVALGSTDEEKAIASLAGFKVADACGFLVSSGDFHLATLVALIGSNDSMRKDMRQQLDDWRKSQSLSEFSQPIRAIYEMLAGNVCVCDGSKGAVEDRVPSFVISKRFGLDWRQAFGLRLWYGIQSNQRIEDAVEMFAQDLFNQKESARPVPWYSEQKVSMLWDDVEHAGREDLLWGLLKLITYDDAVLEDVLCPENSQLSPLDIRLSWQLCQALIACGAREYSREGSSEEKADRNTISFASQLTNEGSWLEATFVLLHLTSDDARAKSIQDHLARHADRIGTEDSLNFITLTQNFKIPSAWIWEAKALFMRSVERDPRAEVECLVKAGAFIEAHRTFSKEVAPKAVVEMDYDTLRELLERFHGKENTISDWHLGGGIYKDFLDLIDGEKKAYGVNDVVLQRLLGSLPAVLESARHPGFMEIVAVETIGGVVAKNSIARSKHGDTYNIHKILKLPLTEDNYLKHSMELSLEYYRGVMTSAR